MHLFSENFTWRISQNFTNPPPFLSSCPTPTLLSTTSTTLPVLSMYWPCKANTRSMRPTWSGFQWCCSWLECSVVVWARRTFLSCWLRSIFLLLCGLMSVQILFCYARFSTAVRPYVSLNFDSYARSIFLLLCGHMSVQILFYYVRIFPTAVRPYVQILFYY